jgi:hypothetical protein
MMPRLLSCLASVALLLLAWTLPPPSCNVWALNMYTMQFTDTTGVKQNEGAWSLEPEYTDALFQDPLVGSVLAWTWPIAVDIGGVRLPPECQPTDFNADGQTWEGI